MKREREEEDSDAGPKDSDVAITCVPGAFTCTMPPTCSQHPHYFKTVEEFEHHYYKYHGFSCSVCHRVFPSQIILELHITENHDSFAQARRARGDKIVSLHQSREFRNFNNAIILYANNSMGV